MLQSKPMVNSQPNIEITLFENLLTFIKGKKNGRSEFWLQIFELTPT